jgi:CheY-like chemotaxis protein
MALLERTHGERVRCRFEPGDGPLLVRMDPTDVRRVLDNLVLNAIEAMEGRGELCVRVAEAPQRQALVEIHDTGRGTFEAPREGRGLGLKVVQDLVERAHGTLRVSSVPGRGAVVRVLVPLADPPPRGSGTILVVDDEPAVRGSVRQVLADSGYRVLEAGDGRAALGLLSKGVDLLLTDLKLPDMDGAELAAAATAACPDLKVVYLSGYAWARPARAEVLAKPAAPEELRERIGALLRP